MNTEFFSSTQEMKQENLDFVMNNIEAGSPVISLATEEGYLVVKRNMNRDKTLIKEFGGGKFIFTGVGGDSDYYELFEITKTIFRHLTEEYSPNLREVYDVHADQLTNQLRRWMGTVLNGNVWSRPRSIPFTASILIAEKDFFGKPLLYAVQYTREPNRDLITEKVEDAFYTLPYTLTSKMRGDDTLYKTPMPEKDAIEYIKGLQGVFDEMPTPYFLEAVSIKNKTFERFIIEME